MIECRDCGQIKPLSDFYNAAPGNNPGRGGKSSYCKGCHAVRSRRTRERHGAKYDKRKNEKRRAKREGEIRKDLGLLPGEWIYSKKRCNTCGEVKDRGAFTPYKNCKSGLRGSCRRCEDSKRRSSKNGIKSRKKRYENIKADPARYEKHLERNRLYRQKYRLSNPGKIKIQGDRYKARRNELLSAASDGSVTPDAIGRMISEAKSCCYCGRKMNRTAWSPRRKTLDHLDPVSMGGRHSVGNLVVCCMECNTKKGAKPFARWLDDVEPCRRSIVRDLYFAKTSQATMRLV